MPGRRNRQRGNDASVPWHRRRRRGPVLWPAGVGLVLVVGTAGYIDQGRSWPDALYQAVRLFTVNLESPEPSWWLLGAAFLAAALTARGIAGLYREQLIGRLVRFAVHPRVVVFGANERSAALLTASPRPGRWRDAIVVVDPDAQALASITAQRVWTVRGDGKSETSLKRAAVGRARNVLVITGDNAHNSAITAAVLDLRPPVDALYAEVEEPGLARALEQGGERVDVPTTTFSATGVAAAAVLDTLVADGPPLLTPEADGSPATVALFGTGPLVDAMVLELHHRRRIQLLDDPGSRPAVPRVLLFGPDATARCGALAAVMGTELQLLDLDPLDVDLRQVVELGVETVRHLARHQPLRRVLVLTPTDLDGGALAISLARHLGHPAEIVLVTESRTTPFGDEICAQTAVSPTLAKVRSFRVPNEVYDLRKLAAERVADRLARALYEVEQPSATRWAQLAQTDRKPYLRRATEAAAAARPRAGVPSGTDRWMLRRAALVALDAPELAPLRALGFSSPTALARAGLNVDFSSLPALVAAGRKLLATDDPAAFGVWAEVARLRTDAAALDRDLPATAGGRDAQDVRALLLLREAVLGSPDARLHLGRGNPGTWTRRAPGDPGNPIVLLAGPDEDPTTAAAWLAPALAHLPARTVVYATAAVPAVLTDRPRNLRTPGAGRPGRADALEMWRAAVTADHHPGDVRVAALPGTGADELLLARALGALVGRVEAPGSDDLNDILLNGADGIVPLPDDRATIRAFLRPSRWPEEFHDRREPLARELHERYVTRQRSRKAAGDPALRFWPVLSPWLKRSNYAVVDDIPAKLAVLGLELEPRPTGPADPVFAELVARNLDLLAELEHGRFTAERLLSGWTRGVRDPARFVSPHLVPWPQLSDEAKSYDREVMLDLPPVLAAQGLGVRRLVS